MNLECRIFKPGKKGKMKLVKTVAHAEIINTTANRRLFNVHPGKNGKIKPRNRKALHGLFVPMPLDEI